jgi:hypothetical protein
MRRALFGICCAAVLLFPAVSRPLADWPALRLIRSAPFVLRGTHFQPDEHVTVTIAARTLHRKSATAGPAGSFTVTFAGLSAGSCRIYGFHATGDRGSSVSFRMATGCPPPQGDEPLFPRDPIPKKTHHP